MSEAPVRPRLAWEFNLSFATIMQAVQVTALLCALVYWFFVNANRGIESERQLGDLKGGVVSQLGEMRQTIAVGLGDMRQQLASLPDQRARLDQGSDALPTSTRAGRVSMRASRSLSTSLSSCAPI
jgi:hypothetical protein